MKILDLFLANENNSSLDVIDDLTTTTVRINQGGGSGGGGYKPSL